MLQGLYGGAEAFWRPASTALLPSIVNPRRLPQANALMAVSVNAAYTIGPAVAGVLVASAGSGVAISVDAASFAVSAAALLVLRVHRIDRPAEPTTLLADLREGWHEFASRTWLWVVVAFAALFLMFVTAPRMVLGPLVAETELGGADDWGFIAAMIGVGVIVGSTAAACDRRGRWSSPS